jgi:hypothetical protein
MRDLVEQTGGDALLANMYGNQVMNVHREDGPTPAVISSSAVPRLDVEGGAAVPAPHPT